MWKCVPPFKVFYNTDDNFQNRFTIEEPKVSETLRGDEWEEMLDKWFSLVNNALYTGEKESEEIGLMLKQFRPENITLTVENSIKSNDDSIASGTTMGSHKNLSINVQDDKRTVCFQNESSSNDEVEILQPEILDVVKTNVDPDLGLLKEVEIMDETNISTTKNLHINVHDNKRTICLQDESSSNDEVEILESEILDVVKSEEDPDLLSYLETNFSKRHKNRKIKRDNARIEMIKKIFAPGFKKYISDPNNIKYEL